MREQRKNLIHYIIPALLANISMFILTVVDGMFVGNGVGTDALGAVSLALTFVLGRPICLLFGAKEAAIEIVKNSLPKYCLNYVFAASSSVIGAYLFSTKRTPYAIVLNICRSLIFNSLCINILPHLFGYDFVWFTVAVAEGICFIIAVVLKNVSERNGIIYR